MKIKLVFDDWTERLSGKSIPCDNEHVDLFLTDFHGGTTFKGTIELLDGDANLLLKQIKKRLYT